jgi:hypothetical protein
MVCRSEEECYKELERAARRSLEARGIEVKTKILRPAWYEATLNRV